jgi:hypothetical protein
LTAVPRTWDGDPEGGTDAAVRVILLMFDFAALEVALGLIFVYLVLSLVSSALNETISSIFSWRAKFLREGIANLLDPKDTKNGEALMEKLYENPLIDGLVRPVSRWRRKRYPSYIPAQTFVAALLDFDGRTTRRRLQELVDAAPSPQVRDALGQLLKYVHGDVAAFQLAAERWFDDSMERVSGWYRRRVQLMLWLLAAAIVLALNVDTVRIAQALWDDRTVRAAVVARAEAAGAQQQEPDIKRVAKDVGSLEELKIPLGWTSETRPGGGGAWAVTIALKALGLLLTAAALTLGAPFWFDTLSKVARIRSAGAPPPATGAVRKGEGEQTRGGPGVATPEPPSP